MMAGADKLEGTGQTRQKTKVVSRGLAGVEACSMANHIHKPDGGETEFEIGGMVTPNATRICGGHCPELVRADKAAALDGF